jgi:hypothetical protein
MNGQGVQDQFQLYGDVFSLQNRSVGGCEDMTLYDQCIYPRKMNGVCDIPHLNLSEQF